MMGNLLDPDLDFQDLNVDELRVIASGGGESVLRRGRAMMELGRRASRDAELLREVAEMIRATENRRIKTAGSASISQLGAAGLVAGGSETAVAMAAELVGEWRRDEQSDFAWLMMTSGITWRRAQTRFATARVRHGIQFVQVDEINCELRIVSSDDAGTFLWAAQWLDEHRGFVVNAARFEATPDPNDEADLTATLVISMNHAGEPPDGREPGRLGPWSHGVPPMPLRGFRPDHR